MLVGRGGRPSRPSSFGSQKTLFVMPEGARPRVTFSSEEAEASTAAAATRRKKPDRRTEGATCILRGGGVAVKEVRGISEVCCTREGEEETPS